MVIVEKDGFSNRQFWLLRLKDCLYRVKVGLFPRYPTIHFIRSQESEALIIWGIMSLPSKDPSCTTEEPIYYGLAPKPAIPHWPLSTLQNHNLSQSLAPGLVQPPLAACLPLRDRYLASLTSFYHRLLLAI